MALRLAQKTYQGLDMCKKMLLILLASFFVSGCVTKSTKPQYDSPPPYKAENSFALNVVNVIGGNGILSDSEIDSADLERFEGD